MPSQVKSPPEKTSGTDQISKLSTDRKDEQKDNKLKEKKTKNTKLKDKNTKDKNIKDIHPKVNLVVCSFV